MTMAILACGMPADAEQAIAPERMVWSEGGFVYVRGEAREAPDIQRGRQMATNDAQSRLIDYIAVEIQTTYSESNGEGGPHIRDEVRIHSQARLQGVELYSTAVDRLTINNQSQIAVTVTIRLSEAQVQKERERIQQEQQDLDQVEFDRKLRERRQLEAQADLERAKMEQADQLAKEAAEHLREREIAAIGTPDTIPWDARRFPPVRFGETTVVNGARYRRMWGPLNWASLVVMGVGEVMIFMSFGTVTNHVVTVTGGNSVPSGTTTSLTVDYGMLTGGVGFAIGALWGLGRPEWHVLERED